VLEQGAPLPAADLRRRQRDAVECWGGYELGRVAATILGFLERHATRRLQSDHA
jgi:hypothetical protein